MANEIERRYGARGLHGLSVMPGGIVTGLQVHVAGQLAAALDAARDYMKSPEQGAATTVYAALSKEWQGRGGRYLEDCQEAGRTDGPSPTAMGYHPRAYNEEGEKKLWVDSLKFVGIEDDN